MPGPGLSDPGRHSGCDRDGGGAGKAHRFGPGQRKEHLCHRSGPGGEPRVGAQAHRSGRRRLWKGLTSRSFWSSWHRAWPSGENETARRREDTIGSRRLFNGKPDLGSGHFCLVHRAAAEDPDQSGGQPQSGPEAYGGKRQHALLPLRLHLCRHRLHRPDLRLAGPSVLPVCGGGPWW